MKNTNYVVGFLFSKCCAQVVLIEKLKPEWQRNRWNGVGGKIEPNEKPIDAMRREFAEETGVFINDWRHFCSLDYGDGFVEFFSAFGDITKVRSMTPEKVRNFYASCLPVSIIPNLAWLIPMAQEGETVANAVIVKANRSWNFPNTSKGLCRIPLTGLRSNHMPAPDENPNIRENNAREEARQQLMLGCPSHCIPGVIDPDCPQHGFPKGNGRVKASAIEPLLTRTVENYAELKRLVHAFLTDFAARNPRSWNHASVYPEVHALIKFINFKP